MAVDSLAFSSIGSTIAISSAAPATIDAAGFGALTYTLINEITDIGSFGETIAKVTHIPLATGVTIKRKGVIDAGTVSVKGARAPTDAGQILVQAGLQAYGGYSFCVTLQSGTKIYFIALIMSYTVNIGAAGAITTTDIGVYITTLPVYVG